MNMLQYTLLLAWHRVYLRAMHAGWTEARPEFLDGSSFSRLCCLAMALHRPPGRPDDEDIAQVPIWLYALCMHAWQQHFRMRVSSAVLLTCLLTPPPRLIPMQHLQAGWRGPGPGVLRLLPDTDRWHPILRRPRQPPRGRMRHEPPYPTLCAGT